jgi:hypothetical protein
MMLRGRETLMGGGVLQREWGVQVEEEHQKKAHREQRRHPNEVRESWCVHAHRNTKTKAHANISGDTLTEGATWG